MAAAQVDCRRTGERCSRAGPLHLSLDAAGLEWSGPAPVLGAVQFVYECADARVCRFRSLWSGSHPAGLGVWQYILHGSLGRFLLQWDRKFLLISPTTC